MLIGKGPGLFEEPVMYRSGSGPMRHYHEGCGCCLLPFLIAGALIAVILILIS